MLIILNWLSNTSSDEELNDAIFHCHVNVKADGLSEWFQTTLNFEDLLIEVCTHSSKKLTQQSCVDFSVYPFLDDKVLG